MQKTLHLDHCKICSHQLLLIALSHYMPWFTAIQNALQWFHCISTAIPLGLFAVYTEGNNIQSPNNNIVLFQFCRAWQFSSDTTPNFVFDINSLIFRFSIDVSFIPVSYLQHGQNKQNLKLVTQGVFINKSGSVATSQSRFQFL